MRPQHGGRLELKLADESGAQARYRLAIFFPLGEGATEVAIDAEGGALTLGEWQGSPPPAWLEALAHALLRTVVRNKNSDGEWPRRITRWRPEPRA